ncbi:MAG: Lrp/AsnC family transcriptional regulator [Nanoarchaeota archaeon]|nr:Lrp/AsnC family transcriptional regulator [Nanoarchaeota archaeon]MBU1135584.1 Lrp/AsnC family transcriptional regulator [Nanoarchaeota archaeon]MBU2520360.1 Lrp/AsnC family transcriptional regulator [Nanoarchaeota archaeon]
MNQKDLDVKDKKILFELDKDSRIPLSVLSKKIGISKEVAFHRLNNLVKRGYISRFQAVISTYRFGYQSYKIYLKLQNLTKEIRVQMQDFFMKNEMVYWICNCQGKYDMIVAYWAKNIRDFGDFENEILNKFSNYIQERDITITRKSTQYNRRWFYNDDSKLVETSFGEDLEEIKLDKIDIEILRNLADNARIKIVDLANKLNISISTIKYRLKRLEKNKVILGYKYALNSKLLNYEKCKAFIYFKNITDTKRKELINYCKSIPNVINIVLTIGSWDVEIGFEVKNFEEYYKIMSDIQEKYSDIVKSYESILFSSEPKQVFMPGIKSI